MHLNGEVGGGGEERGEAAKMQCVLCAEVLSLHPSIKINKSKC